MYSEMFGIHRFRNLNRGELETESKNGFYLSDLSLCCLFHRWMESLWPEMLDTPTTPSMTPINYWKMRCWSNAPRRALPQSNCCHNLSKALSKLKPSFPSRFSYNVLLLIDLLPGDFVTSVPKLWIYYSVWKHQIFWRLDKEGWSLSQVSNTSLSD